MRVCFVALNAYPAIDPKIPGGFGGIETRSWLFAKSLATNPDLEVSFLVRHHQPLRQENYAGVKLHLLKDPLYAKRDSLLSRLKSYHGIPWISQPRWSDIYYLPRLAIGKLLRRRSEPTNPDPFYNQIEADLFLTFGVQSISATVISSAHATSRKSVLFLGSDHDLDESFVSATPQMSVYRDRADVCGWVLKHADTILCQTISQQDILQERFARSGTLIANPIDIDEWGERMGKPLEKLLKVVADLERYVLWVGRADSVHKRPQLLIELAKRCPEIPFLMIMNPRDDTVEANIRRDAPSNVTIIREVPFTQMPAIFAKATCFINTSSLEGFPNTFLQATVSGVPIGSLEVEPKYLQESQAGCFAAGDMNRLAEYVHACWSGEEELPSSAMEYVLKHHSLKSQTEQLTKVLTRAAQEGTE